MTLILLISLVQQVLQVTTGKEGSLSQRYLIRRHTVIKMQIGLVWAIQIRRAHILHLGSLLQPLLHRLLQKQKVRN